MTGKELLERLKKMSEEELALEVFLTSYEYQGSTSNLKEIKVVPKNSWAGPAGIFLS